MSKLRKYDWQGEQNYDGSMDTETFFGGASDPRNNYQLSNYLDQGREYLPGLSSKIFQAGMKTST